jgi:hypothetical protein
MLTTGSIPMFELDEMLCSIGNSAPKRIRPGLGGVKPVSARVRFLVHKLVHNGGVGTVFGGVGKTRPLEIKGLGKWRVGIQPTPRMFPHSFWIRMTRVLERPSICIQSSLQSASATQMAN